MITITIAALITTIIPITQQITTTITPIQTTVTPTLTTTTILTLNPENTTTITKIIIIPPHTPIPAISIPIMWSPKTTITLTNLQPQMLVIMMSLQMLSVPISAKDILNVRVPELAQIGDGATEKVAVIVQGPT